MLSSIIGDLTYRLGFKLKRGSLNAAKKGVEDVDNAARRATRSTRTLGSALRGVAISAITVGVFQLARGLVSSIAEFQRLEAVLETVTGSQQAAAEAMSFIEDIATRLPFSVQQVSNAFIRLRGSGIQATEETMMALGNVAGTFGSDLESLVTAAQNAGRGHARLLETILRTDVDARTSATHLLVEQEGQMVRVEKSTRSVIAWLEELGRTRYAGGADRLMNTLQGAFSNLGDALSRFARAVGRAGFAESLNNLAVTFTGIAQTGGAVATVLGGSLALAVDILVGSVELLTDYWYLFAAAILTLTEGGIIAGLTRVWRALNTQILISQWQLLAAVGALAILLLGIQDFVYFMRGHDSVLGRLIPEEDQDRVREGLRDIWNVIKLIVGGLLNPIAWFEQGAELGLRFGAALHQWVQSLRDLWAGFVRDAEESINTLYRALNRIPGVNIELINTERNNPRTGRQRGAIGALEAWQRSGEMQDIMPHTFPALLQSQVERLRAENWQPSEADAAAGIGIQAAAARQIRAEHNLNLQQRVEILVERGHTEEEIENRIEEAAERSLERQRAELYEQAENQLTGRGPMHTLFGPVVGDSWDRLLPGTSYGE